MSTEHEATEPTADATPDAPLDRGVVIGEGLTTLARWSWRLLLVAGASVVLWWLLAKLWVGVFPILLALIVATVLWPPTRWLRSKGVPDALAAALVIVGSLAIVFGVLGAILLAIVAGWSIAWIFTWFGTVGKTAQGVQGVSLKVMFPLTFLSNAMVPTSTLPGWLKAFVRHNPVSHIVDGDRYLLDGTAGSAGDVRAAIIGSLLILAIMAPLTVVRYQRRNA